MKLNLYLRGIDLLDLEFHCGSKGLYLDVNVFRPRESAEPDALGTTAAQVELAPGPVYGEDHSAVVRTFGFAT